MIARERLRGGFTQRPAGAYALALHAGGDFFDVARYVADLDAEFAGLRSNIADDRVRTETYRRKLKRVMLVSLMARMVRGCGWRRSVRCRPR